MIVYRSGEKVYEDPADRADGPHEPVTFTAMSGDTSKLEVYSNDAYGGAGPITVLSPSKHAAALVAGGALDPSPNTTTKLALTRELPLWNIEPVE